MRGIFVTACAGVVGVCPLAVASPTIVYVDIVDRVVNRVPAAFDLNLDGINDFTVFRGEETATAITGANADNQVLIQSTANPYAVMLSPLQLINDEGLRQRTGNLAVRICEQGGGCSWFGPFPQVGAPGFIGFEFLIDDMTHYGWMRLEVASVNGVPTIFDYAYESRPDTAIRAGQTPAPSTGLAICLWAAVARRRR